MVLRSKATPLDRVNVDTDQIVPKQFLKLVNRTGFGKYLFYDWRFDMDGKPRSDFVLNNPKYSGVTTLAAAVQESTQYGPYLTMGLKR